MYFNLDLFSPYLFSVFESEHKTQLTCYYCLLENDKEESEVKGQESEGQTDQRKYIICFLAQPADNLEQYPLYFEEVKLL